jgi:hypothetical protein
MKSKIGPHVARATFEVFLYTTLYQRALISLHSSFDRAHEQKQETLVYTTTSMPDY